MGLLTKSRPNSRTSPRAVGSGCASTDQRRQFHPGCPGCCPAAWPPGAALRKPLANVQSSHPTLVRLKNRANGCRIAGSIRPVHGLKHPWAGKYSPNHWVRSTWHRLSVFSPSPLPSSIKSRGVLSELIQRASSPARSRSNDAPNQSGSTRVAS